MPRAVPLLTLVTALIICSYPAIMFAFPNVHIFFIVLLGILSFFDCSVPSATLILSHLAMIFLYYSFLTHLISVT